MKKITLSLMVASSLVYSASNVVESIQYDGIIHISESVAKHLNEIKVGEPLDPIAVDKTIKNFFDQGYFQDIWVENNDGKVVLHFKEKPVISKIELKGYKENDEEARKKLLQLDKGTLFDEKRLEEAKKRILEALSKDGKIDSVVEVQSKKLENGSMHVTFIVNEGQEIIIQQLTYDGIKALEPDQFEKNVANKEHEFMGWMWGRNDGKMKLSELEYDPLRIRDYYMQNGYLDAKVEAPFVSVNFDSYEAKMSYSIFEGDIYRVSDILVFQDAPVIDDKELLEIIKLEKNKPFNIKTFREDADRIKTKIADLGYAFVQVQPDLRKDKEGKSVDVVYRIAPGKKVHIRNVIISGNNRTLDRVVRRELFLAPGDQYSMTNIKDSKNAIGRTGYFESNTIEEKRVDDETIDLVIQAKEAPTGNIQLGGGYGSFGGLLLSVGVNDRNVFGSGINTGVRLERSLRTSNYSFNITNPRLSDSDYSGNFSIFQTGIKYDTYTIQSTGMSFGLGHRFSRYVTGYMGYNYSQNRYSDVTVDLPAFYQNYSKSSVITSLTFDNTDDYYIPREGITLSESIEQAGLGGDTTFTKSRTMFGYYQGLQKWIDFDAIFRYKARYNYVNSSGYLPYAEKFYLGGIGSLRGYRSYSVSPLMLNTDGTVAHDANGNVIRTGAKQSFSNSIEFSIPLVPEARMRATGFFDYGMIGDGSITDIKRSSYGIALEWFSPVGPLQLVFANALGAQANDNITHFEFTIGQRF